MDLMASRRMTERETEGGRNRKGITNGARRMVHYDSALPPWL